MLPGLCLSAIGRGCSVSHPAARSLSQQLIFIGRSAENEGSPKSLRLMAKSTAIVALDEDSNSEANGRAGNSSHEIKKAA